MGQESAAEKVAHSTRKPELNYVYATYAVDGEGGVLVSVSRGPCACDATAWC